ncbi:hypothetical protein POM88_004131 [Heracleum sosnowskyi]|uniref:Uncharacterized protein n=1 Tax=Heracleum sosnowskyi TaxID=360622 RepID=A0AAD8JIW8_9APIA|nr:hypothetical protein POM88_004131 [Heracleum sosnowskyi]
MMIRFVQIRSFKWCLAVDLTRQEVSCLWYVNPEGVILLSNKNKAREWFVEGGNSLVGITNGSFLMDNSGNSSSGIGGYILNKDQKIIFTFSGPVLALSPLDAEMQAILCIAKIMSQSFPNLQMWIIGTDNVLAVRRWSKIRA